MTNNDRKTSVPPEAKIIAAQSAARVAAYGAAGDIIGMIGALILALADKIGGLEALGAITLLATGAAVGKMRGKGGGTSSGTFVALLAGKGVLATLLKKTIIGAIVLSSGCGLFSDGGQLRHDANALRTELNSVAAEYGQWQTTAVAACSLADKVPAIQAPCGRLVDIDTMFRSAYPLAHDAIDVAEDVGASLDRGAQAIALTRRALTRLRALTVEVVDAVADGVGGAPIAGDGGQVGGEGEPPAEGEAPASAPERAPAAGQVEAP